MSSNVDFLVLNLFSFLLHSINLISSIYISRKFYKKDNHSQVYIFISIAITSFLFIIMKLYTIIEGRGINEFLTKDFGWILFNWMNGLTLFLINIRTLKFLGLKNINVFGVRLINFHN